MNSRSFVYITARLTHYPPPGPPRHCHNLMQQSSPAEASKPGWEGCHRTQLTSSGCACSRLHSRLNEAAPMSPPPPLSLSTPSRCCCCCCGGGSCGRMNSCRTLAAPTSPDSGTAAADVAAAAASPKTRIELSAQALAMRPSLDQSTEKTVRSWSPTSVLSRRHCSCPAPRQRGQAHRRGCVGRVECRGGKGRLAVATSAAAAAARLPSSLRHSHTFSVASSLQDTMRLPPASKATSHTVESWPTPGPAGRVVSQVEAKAKQSQHNLCSTASKPLKSRGPTNQGCLHITQPLHPQHSHPARSSPASVWAHTHSSSSSTQSLMESS